MLWGGFANEALIDLTGCPTAYYDFQDEFVKMILDSGEFWKLLWRYDEEGYLLSGSTPGEEWWMDPQELENESSLLPGHSYAIVQIKDIQGHKLLNIWNPWGNFEWTGRWSDSSPEWTEDIRAEINPNLGENDGTFWMCFEDYVSIFKGVNVCWVKNWEEVRIKGKFIWVQNIEDPNIEVVLSKWYYSLDVNEPTRLIIGLHQEDERI